MPKPNTFWDEMDSSLRSRSQNGLSRSRRVWKSTSARSIVSEDGVSLVNFGSNDYLGLSWHPELRLAMANAENSFDNELPSSSSVQGPKQAPSPLSQRVGAGASPLITGYSEDHLRLTTALAELENSEDAVVFSSGFAANVGTITALATQSDVLFCDRLNHASLIDGCRLSRAKIIVYPHNDLAALRSLVRDNRSQGTRAFVVTDSVFSMDGDTADLVGIAELCDEFDMLAIIDEAHATGVYGRRGSGLVEHSGCESDRLIRVGTLSKGVGCVGGFVAGKSVLIEWLINFCRPYIYSTSLPLPLVRAATRGIQLVQELEGERVKLRATSTRLRELLQDVGLRIGGSDSPIVALYAPGVKEVVEWSTLLRQQGFFVPAIRPPTVPVDGCLLRISLNAMHTEQDIEAVARACRF